MSVSVFVFALLLLAFLSYFYRFYFVLIKTESGMDGHQKRIKEMSITHTIIECFDATVNESNINCHCLVLFSLPSQTMNEMNEINDNLGWKSCSEILQNICDKMVDYCKWYSNDFGVKIDVFPDFDCAEFIVFFTNIDGNGNKNKRISEDCHSMISASANVL